MLGWVGLWQYHTDPAQDISLSKFLKDSEYGTTSLDARVERRRKNWNDSISTFWENEEFFFKGYFTSVEGQFVPRPPPQLLRTLPCWPRPVKRPMLRLLLAIVWRFLCRKNKILKETCQTGLILKVVIIYAFYTPPPFLKLILCCV